MTSTGWGDFPGKPAGDPAEFRAIHDDTPAVYERNAAGWDAHRSRVLFEQPWLDRFAACLPAGASVLDVGCGAGEPIAACFIGRGFQVTGVDVSPAMLAICRARFPASGWHQADMRELALAERFAGIVAWDSFFHLDADEQRAVLNRFCRHLRPGGALLLTIGHEAGEVLGTVEGEAVYHASLNPGEYHRILLAAGFTRIELWLEDEHCAGHSILLASGFRPRPGE